MPSDPTFDVVADEPPESTLLAGFSEFGLAGLTAADYLVDQLGLEERGHVETRGLPTMTPFEDGTPRHHTRLFGDPDRDITVLVGELFVPSTVAEQFVRALVEWGVADGLAELVVLSGVPYQHGPEDHRPFYIATPGYRERRLADVDITPMGRGYLDGVNGAAMQRGLSGAVDTCLFTTPAHERTPDIEAALRLLDAVERVYELELDTGPLESFAAEIEQHYRDLAARIEQANAEQVPEDRMYM